MKRYLVFAGNDYYPSGGWKDLKGDAHSKDAALLMVANLSCDWWQIVDTETRAVIHEGNRQ